MSVYKMKDRPHGRPRKKPWRAVVPRKDGPPRRRQFEKEEHARMWHERMSLDEWMKDVPEHRKRRELEDLRKYTVRDMILAVISERKARLSANDFVELHAFQRRGICSKSVVDFTQQVAKKYIAERGREIARGKDEHVTPRTVSRDKHRLQSMWQYAIDNWEGFASLPNPWTGIRITGSTGGRRQRTLEEGELEKLDEACQHCLSLNRYYLPLAIHLAIDTGMRRQEITNLRWDDIDFEKRRIVIRKSKTDRQTGNKNLTIVLPLVAEFLLSQLALSLHRNKCLPGPEQIPSLSTVEGTEKIFPMTGSALTQAFGDVVRRAGLPDIPPDKGFHFHDLRRAATTKLILAGLSLEERNIQLRHADKSQDATYHGRSILLKQIEEKLDRYDLKGQTRAEFEKEKGDNRMTKAELAEILQWAEQHVEKKKGETKLPLV
jgi:integrase